MRSGRSSRLWGTRSTTGHLESLTISADTSATRRDFTEIPITENLVSSDGPSRAMTQDLAISHVTANGASSNEASQALQEPPQTDHGVQRDPELGQAASFSSQHEMPNSHESRPNRTSWRNLFWRRKPERKGYWDLLSFFRSSGSRSVTDSATQPEKAAGDV